MMITVLNCMECGKSLTQGVKAFSLDVFGYPLCVKHQVSIAESGASPQAVALYFALKLEKIPVILEYWDGHKHVDIALPGRLYIEVNGSQHCESLQALIDLRRTVYSLEENVSTILVPNYLLDHPGMFRATVKELTKACKLLMRPTRLSNQFLSMN